MKRNFYKRSKLGPITAYRIGLGPLIGKVVLLLTTTGRSSGLQRVTPLQYELIDDVYHVAAVFGTKSDWVRNIQVNPKVHIDVKNQHIDGNAAVFTDPEEIADFIQFRMKKHPRMMKFIMKMDGLTFPPAYQELVGYCRNLALVRITPDAK